MKKSAIALAVAAALVGSSAFADTTLYGSARVSVDYYDIDTTYYGYNVRNADGSLVPIDKGYDTWDVYNNSSRLGVRGEEDLGAGLSAIYQYEFGVDTTEGGNWNSNRPKWVGLKGDSWGAVTLGTQWTPYYNVMGISDIFNSSRLFDQNTGYLGSKFGTRLDNSVMYSSPNWSGFSFQGMLVMNGDIGADDASTPEELSYCDANNKLPCDLSNGIDMYQIGASYKNGPWFAGATYMSLEGDDFNGYFDATDYVGLRKTRPSWDGDMFGVAFGYNQGPFAVTFNYETGDAQSLFFDDADNYYLTGAYTFGNSVIRAAYGYTDPDKSRVYYYADGARTDAYVKQDNISTYILGYQYNFSKRTRVWAEYGYSDTDSDLIGNKQMVSLGTRVDF